MMSAITGKLTGVLAKLNAQQAQMQNQMQSVKLYCKYRQLPFDLRRSVKEYFDVRVAQKATYDEEKILKDMSPSLKAQVVCYIFKNVIRSVPFFHGCSELFLSAVLCCMEPILFAPADIIIQKGQREMSMFILAKGRAAVVTEKGKVIKELSMGTYVGEIGLFFGVRRTATVCSISFCDTFKLMQGEFVKLQETYPDMQQLIASQAEAMFSEGISCYLCGKVGHVCIQCPRSKNVLMKVGKTTASRVSEDFTNATSMLLQTRRSSIDLGVDKQPMVLVQDLRNQSVLLAKEPRPSLPTPITVPLANLGQLDGQKRYFVSDLPSEMDTPPRPKMVSWGGNVDKK